VASTSFCSAFLSSLVWPCPLAALARLREESNSLRSFTSPTACFFSSLGDSSLRSSATSCSSSPTMSVGAAFPRLFLAGVDFEGLLTDGEADGSGGASSGPSGRGLASEPSSGGGLDEGRGLPDGGGGGGGGGACLPRGLVGLVASLPPLPLSVFLSRLRDRRLWALVELPFFLSPLRDCGLPLACLSLLLDRDLLASLRRFVSALRAPRGLRDRFVALVFLSRLRERLLVDSLLSLLFSFFDAADDPSLRSFSSRIIPPLPLAGGAFAASFG